MNNTQAKNPPMESSKESTSQELQLAKDQGEAYKKALDYMTTQVDEGSVKHAGDYQVGYAIEKAEGMYYPVHGQLEWRDPTDQNAHIEVTVRDDKDGRFIPGLVVMVTVLDERGNEIGTRQLPFLWHPWLYHYGLDWKVPGEGKYTLRIHIDVPPFPRHDKKNGQRYAEPVEVEFKNVTIKPGQKK
jgi:hypothetical protein